MVATAQAGELSLSIREIEVLVRARDGMTATQIARDLGITTATCRDHLKSVRRKLDCQSTLQAVVQCLRAGIISLS